MQFVRRQSSRWRIAAIRVGKHGYFSRKNLQKVSIVLPNWFFFWKIHFGKIHTQKHLCVRTLPDFCLHSTSTICIYSWRALLGRSQVSTDALWRSRDTDRVKIWNWDGPTNLNTSQLTGVGARDLIIYWHCPSGFRKSPTVDNSRILSRLCNKSKHNHGHHVGHDGDHVGKDGEHDGEDGDV